MFVRLYKNYVRPHLEFATPAWSPWTEADKKGIEDVQKRAVRMISGLWAVTCEEKLKEIGLSTLEERRDQADMYPMYKILHGHDLRDGGCRRASNKSCVGPPQREDTVLEA